MASTISTSGSAITFSGLASGLDSSSIIKALVGAASVPITSLQQTESDNKSKSTQLTDIKSQLTALQTASQALNTKQGALTNSATSSNTSVLGVTTSGGAALGTYKVTVNNLATAQRTYSNSVSASDKTGLFGTGTLAIGTADGSSINVDVTSTDTLASLATKINASGANVSAAVFNDGKGGYRLQVNGTQTGASNAITFGETGGLSLGLSDPTNIKQPATDASVTIDGMEVKSSSNTVSDAVPGVLLNLTDTGSSTIKVDRDSSALQTKAQAFIDAYNKVTNSLNTVFTYSGAAKGSNTLVGDLTMQTLQGKLRQMVTAFTPNGDSNITMMSSLGINIQQDGTLQLDQDKFTKATQSDPDGVASFFAGRTDGTGAMNTINGVLDPYTQTGGTIDLKVQSFSTANKHLDDQIASMQKRIDTYQQQLTLRYANLESTISSLNSQSSSLTAMLTKLQSSSQ